MSTQWLLRDRTITFRQVLERIEDSGLTVQWHAFVEGDISAAMFHVPPWTLDGQPNDPESYTVSISGDEDSWVWMAGRADKRADFLSQSGGMRMVLVQALEQRLDTDLLSEHDDGFEEIDGVPDDY